MLLPESKERELRFKLALRMGLPIFFFAVLLIFIGLSEYFDRIPASFYITAVLILGVMVYFIFFLIYAGFEERITDPISGTFSREYLMNYLSEEMEKGPYTILLVTIDNLHDINERYGTKNGDRVLREFAYWVGDFLKGKGVERFPIGHYKGGDFFVGLRGPQSQYLSFMELICLKAESYMIDDIELQVSGAMVDTQFSSDMDQLITQLFEQQLQRRMDRDEPFEEEAPDPSELESLVITAVRQQRVSLMFQAAFHGKKSVIYDASVKLLGKEAKLIHQKRFMPVINRLGLSRSYDVMVLETLLKVCIQDTTGRLFSLSLFPSTVRNHHFFEKVQMLFAENEKVRGRIIFMLSEKEYYNPSGRFNEVLQSYRRMGILIGLDHFGSYHTTMLYLKELDVDVVRYDMHFGKHIKEVKTQALLRGLDLSAHHLGVKSWMKMIEDDTGVHVASEIGIDYLQGNYLGKIALLNDKMEHENEVR